MMRGWLRADGRKGIRNVVAVAYLVECAHHVARKIAEGTPDAHVIGFPGCFPNPYAQRMMERLCTHPNVGAVCLVSLGCESFDRVALERAVRESGRPVITITIQTSGGTAPASRRAAPLSRTGGGAGHRADRADGGVGAGRGHGLRRVGRDVGHHRQPGRGDRLRQAGRGGRGLHLRRDGRADRLRGDHGGAGGDAELAMELTRSVEKAARYYATLGYGSFAAGNADGGSRRSRKNRSAPT